MFHSEMTMDKLDIAGPKTLQTPIPPILESFSLGCAPCFLDTRPEPEAPDRH